MVKPPHSETEERFLKADLCHNALVLLVERDFFLEVVDHIFVGVGIEDEVEELPEVEVVLPDTEDLLFFWVFLVLSSEETGKLAVVVVDIVLVLIAGVVKADVVQDIEFFLLLCEFLAVCCEVDDFPLNEAFEVGGVDS